MTVQTGIEEKLRKAFAPATLIVDNESHLHAGHASSPGTGVSHFRIRLVSARFAGLNRIARQRLVYEVLAGELSGQIHALSLQCLTPEEAEKDV